MPRSQLSVIIERPVEEVFDFMADFSSDAEWRSGVVAMRQTSPQRCVGATHVEVRRVPGRTIETPAEVVAFVPNRLITFQRTSGPIRPRGTYRYAPVPGGTRLTFLLEVPLHGAWRALTPAIAPLVALIIRTSRKDFVRLKALLESRVLT
jgi:uncharacterized protein YndB with AHSA1/START domain